MIFLFQFTGVPNPETQAFAQSSTIDSLFISFLLVGIFIAAFIAGLFILRAIMRSKSQEAKAFNRVVLEIKVPKERKSEGSGGNVGQEDRLEHIREEIAATETFFSSIAGLKAQRGIRAWLMGRDDHASCEIVVHNNLIYFYIDCPKEWRQFIEQQIHAQHHHAQIEVITDYNLFHENSTIVGANLTRTQPSSFPFKTYKTIDSDPLSGTLNVLAKIYEQNSSAAIQFVVRSANKKWRSEAIKLVREVKKGKKFEDVIREGLTSKIFGFFGDMTKTLFKKGPKEGQPPEEKYNLSSMEEEMLKGVEEKLSKGGLDVTVRLLSVSDNEVTARANLDNLINAFSPYNLYRFGNSFKALIPKNQTKLIREFIYRSFNEKLALTINTEEMSSLWHLPLHSTEAPNIKWLQGRTSAPPSNLPKEGILLGHVDYRGIDSKIRMKENDRRRHLYVIGKSGGGKSVFVESLAKQDIENGHGVCVIDPHGDLVEYLLGHIPQERADDVIVFSPSDFDRPMGLNMLEAQSEDQRDFAVQEMISIFYKLFPPEMIGPMFEHQMRNVMLTLMADVKNPGTIIDIPRMFTDDEYVKTYLKKLKDPVVRAYWEKEMAQTSDFHKSEMLGYLVSKVGRFVENDMMRNIMGQQKSSFDFRDIMDNNKIILVNLSKGTTGEVNAKLLGLIVVAKLQMAALGRADMEESKRKDFFLYIDEFQNFVTDSIATILSEARKYRLNLIIAHQYMGQLVDDKGRPEIRDAVLGNAGTICAFRVGPDDSEVLAKEFAPTFGAYDLINCPKFSCYTKLLIDNTASKPFNMKTYPPEEGNPELASAIKQLSRLKYGRDRKIVEDEILDRTKIGEAPKSAAPAQPEPTL